MTQRLLHWTAQRHIEGMTKDGTHPTANAARIIGQTIRAALLKG